MPSKSKVIKMRGGNRKGAGRPKGSTNKRTVEQQKLAEGYGAETPLEYMLSVMRDPGADFKRRDDMAKAAAPYVHAKVSEKPKTIGKKEQAEQDAATAAIGTEWDDLDSVAAVN